MKNLNIQPNSIQYLGIKLDESASTLTRGMIGRLAEYLGGGTHR